MERLTKRSNKTVHENGVCCTHFRGKECSERMGECTDNCPWEEAAWSKLADYEDIGTVSEFRELKEKATPKKIGHCVFYREMGHGTPWQCLTCGADQTKVEFSCEDGSEPEEKHTFCWCCGQHLDWSKGKE